MISRTENNMKMTNFFINKWRKGCIQAATPLTFWFGCLLYNTWWFFIVWVVLVATFDGIVFRSKGSGFTWNRYNSVKINRNYGLFFNLSLNHRSLRWRGNKIRWNYSRLSRLLRLDLCVSATGILVFPILIVPSCMKSILLIATI